MASTDTAAAPSLPFLHRDVLQCVLAFLSLSELAKQAVPVSRGWLDAVATMRPLFALHSAPQRVIFMRADLAPLLSSPLRRHVDTLGEEARRLPVTVKSLTLSALAERMPHLRTLSANVIMQAIPVRNASAAGGAEAGAGDASVSAQPPPPPVAVQLPQQLRSLKLRFVPSRKPSAPHAQRLSIGTAVVTAIACLPQLESLELLQLPVGVSLHPLSRLASLRCFTVHLEDVHCTQGSSLVGDLRALSQLRVLHMVSRRSDFHARVLAPPHAFSALEQLVCQPSDMPFLSARMVAALAATPSLTLVQGYVESDVDGLDWLTAMPRLRSVHLGLSSAQQPRAPLARDLPTLTELRLSCGDHYVAEDLRHPLERTPVLQSLHLESFDKVRSLSFLRAEPLAHSLRALHLQNIKTRYGEPGLPLSELEHVHALLHLESLSLVRCFTLSAEQLALYEQRPSPLLPALRAFHYVPSLMQ